MQIYKEMNIGTAKIMDTKGIPHHLLSIRSVSEPYSVYEYQKDARKILDEFIKNNKNVIIVGGSGLYVKALLYDYKFNVENDNNQYDNLSNEDIYTEIKKLNNEVDIHINNRKRLVRMLNKLKNNNKLYNNGDTLLYDNVYFIGLSTDRTTLYKRIDVNTHTHNITALIHSREFFSGQAQLPIFYETKETEMNTQVVNQRKENIMDEKAEKIMELAKKLETEDEYICQDNRDLLELEQRYEKLDIPYQMRRVIDDYIACMRTRDERFAQLCCMAGC